MYIIEFTTSNVDSITGNIVHHGEGKYSNPKPVLKIQDVPNVHRILVDGHELKYVEQNMTNLPCPTNKRVVIFYGDIAKLVAQVFIY